MGPNEAQLRAALHEGEGDGLDAGALISHAVHVRRDRRRRVTSIVGAAAVVAVIGLGTAGIVALGRGGGNPGAADSAGGRAAASGAGAAASGVGAGSAAGAGKAPVSPPAVQSSSKATGLPACPATPTHYRLPGTQNSREPLFDRPVAAMRVCTYRDGAGPTSAALTGAEARALATTVDTPAGLGSTVKCPAGAPVAGGGFGTIELLAVDAHGSAFPPVVITVDCGLSPATNGTALRFLPNVPARVMKLLPSVPGHVVGSPVR